jgi:hypothetical protein
MKTSIPVRSMVAATFALGAALCGASAHASDVHWSIGISAPIYPGAVNTVISNAPPQVYYPAPVFVQPAPIYYRPAPRVIYGAPQAYYAPPPVVVHRLHEPRGDWRSGYYRDRGRDRDHDRDDWRDGGNRWRR